MPPRRPLRRRHALPLLLLWVLPSCQREAPAPVSVVTEFELLAPSLGGAVPWRCATALSGSGRQAPAMRAVFGPDGDGVTLDAANATAALRGVAAEFGARGVPTIYGSGGADAAVAAIDAGVPAVVPFTVAGGARPVLVSGYRNVEEDGRCTAVLQDILVVDTVEVMAYGLPVADYRARLAGAGVVAIDIGGESANMAALNPAFFASEESP